MTTAELLGTTAWFVVVVLVAIGLGSLLVALIPRLLPRAIAASPQAEEPLAEHVGIALMIGLGAFGWLATWAGLLGVFTKATLLGILVVAFALSVRQYALLGRRLVVWFRSLNRGSRVDPVAVLLFTTAACFLAALYLAAMQPPYASDELHYHFPQADLIAQSGRLAMPLGGHPFYGNIPKLMEVIFACGIAIAGYSLAHALHLAFVVGFALFVAGFLTRHYGLRTGSLAVVGILLYREYTWNATVGFVDAATATVEISALLLFVDWFAFRAGRSLAASAMLLGIALGMKYSPLPTVLFIGVVTLVIAFRRDRPLVRPALVFVGAATVFGGFWYLRNLVLFGNPVYPFYLSHTGIPDEAYRALIAEIRQFEQRTVGHFLSTPIRFYNSGEVIPAFAMGLAPFAVAVARPRSVHLALIAYCAFYATYWFFVATHQMRFLMPAILVALILAAILVVRFPWALIASLAAAIVVLRVGSDPGPMRYALGGEARSEFLQKHFGCHYAVIEHLEQRRLGGTVIDNWSQWHAPSVTFFAKQNAFQRFSFPLDQRGPAALAAALRRGDIRYVYLDSGVKSRHLANEDPEIARGREERATVEQMILEHSAPVFAAGSCTLYQINAARIESDSLRTHPVEGNARPTSARPRSQSGALLP